MQWSSFLYAESGDRMLTASLLIIHHTIPNNFIHYIAITGGREYIAPQRILFAYFASLWSHSEMCFTESLNFSKRLSPCFMVTLPFTVLKSFYPVHHWVSSQPLSVVVVSIIPKHLTRGCKCFWNMSLSHPEAASVQLHPIPEAHRPASRCFDVKNGTLPLPSSSFSSSSFLLTWQGFSFSVCVWMCRLEKETILHMFCRFFTVSGVFRLFLFGKIESLLVIAFIGFQLISVFRFSAYTIRFLVGWKHQLPN